MKTPGPLYAGAVKARRLYMAYARECMTEYHRTMDPVYVEIARIHVKTARIYNRNAWKGRARIIPGKRP